MKNSIYILTISLFFLLVNSTASAESKMRTENDYKLSCVTSFGIQKADTAMKVIYTCPMHSDVISDKPGKCPKCGMNLVKKEAVKETYTCPMHPEVVQDKPGKCPKCGMNLVKKQPVKK